MFYLNKCFIYYLHPFPFLISHFKRHAGKSGISNENHCLNMEAKVKRRSALPRKASRQDEEQMKRQRLCRTTHASWLRPQTLAPISTKSSGVQYFSSTTSTGLGWGNSENTLTALSDRGSAPQGLPSLFGVVISGLIFQGWYSPTCYLAFTSG